MNDVALAAVLAIFTFVMVGTITFTVVTRVQYLKAGLRLVRKDTE